MMHIGIEATSRTFYRFEAVNQLTTTVYFEAILSLRTLKHLSEDRFLASPAEQSGQLSKNQERMWWQTALTLISFPL